MSIDWQPADYPEFWTAHVQRMLDSYAHWKGQQLIDRGGSALDQAQRLFEADFVIVSHTQAADPILNYGNRAALELWEFDISTLLQTPSRFTAEPMHRDERAQLLARTTEFGYVDDYRGIRISRTGQRFMIEEACVWNLIDEQANQIGQAATFDRYVRLPANEGN